MGVRRGTGNASFTVLEISTWRCKNLIMTCVACDWVMYRQREAALLEELAAVKRALGQADAQLQAAAQQADQVS